MSPDELARAAAAFAAVQEKERLRSAGVIPAKAASTAVWVRWALRMSGCIECGARWPSVDFSELHVDHTVARNGRASPMLWNRTHPREILQEFADYRCVIRCESCHRTRHRSVVEVAEQLSLFVGSGEAWRTT